MRSDTDTGQNCCRENLRKTYFEVLSEVFEVKATILLKNESVCRCISLHNIIA